MAVQGLSYPPLDGSLFLPDMVEFNTRHNPAHAFYTFYDEQVNGLCHVSHLEFYCACQRVAHAVRPNREGNDGDIVAIIANCDTILYQALTMGTIFAGLIPFPMSPRNSSAAVVNMLRKTGCRRLIVTRHSLEPLLDGISSELADLRVEESPTLAYAYPELGKERADVLFTVYPKAERRPANDDVLYYLHSSGSTGFPKPIPITNVTAVHWCIMPSMLEHVRFPRHLTICAASLPPFHTMGVFTQLFFPIVSLKSVAVFSPTSFHDPTKAPIIPNTENTINVVQLTKANSLVVVPTFLEEWVSSAQVVDVLSSLEYVVFGGGPLAQNTGNVMVAAGVKLASIYGGTEFGPLTYVLRNPADQHLWEWVRFGPNQSLRWASQGDGTYELQVLTSATHQLSLENLPDVKGYATSDVFYKHPNVEGLYKIVGRLDDVLIHSSGEKTVPAPMETVIGASPILAGACIFGRGRSQTGVLVEPRPEHAIDVSDDRQVAEFRNKIWREVEEANKVAPAFSRIFKEMILVTARDKPMLRAGKGTVIKKATIGLYELQIDALYASLEGSAKAGIDVPLPSAWSQADVEKWLAVHAAAVNGKELVDFDVDVFDQGFDSLSATFLKNRIMGSLAASPDEKTRDAASRISQNIIFSNPTLQLLARHLIRLLVGKESTPLTDHDPKVEMEDMIAKYSIGLGDETGVRTKCRSSPPSDKHTVLLTGSTGGLGSYLLASLLSREDVAVVYAFNRPSNARTIQQRQLAAFVDRGFDPALLDSVKLIHVEGDAALANLSLDDQTFCQIRDSVTVIVHNAWRLDFNLALSSFEPNVRGTRHLIDLARTSNRATKPRFMFTSSIASAQGWEKRRGAFPEEVQFDAGVAVGLGYGASKYVSERILALSGLAVTSFRIGQITGGAPRGAWSTTDWVPIIVKSSIALGALPNGHGVVSWLPPHAVSNAILDVAFSDEEPPLAVNLVHPRPVAWKSLMQPVAEIIHKKGLTPLPLPLIPFSEWVERLERYAAVHAREEDVRRVPAVKILEFMRNLARGDDEAMHAQDDSAVSPDASGVVALGLEEIGGGVMFATDVARRTSGTVRGLESLSEEDAAGWVGYWESVGMFSD